MLSKKLEETKTFLKKYNQPLECNRIPAIDYLEETTYNDDYQIMRFKSAVLKIITAKR